MTEYLFKLPENHSGTLQAQIQEMMVNAILNRHLAPGSSLPSGRKLAEQLKVARNTVVLAYQNLMDEGFIESKQRSGFYVREDVLDGYAARPSHGKESELDWSQRLVSLPRNFSYNRKPKNWQTAPYPFLCGQFDKKLFPIADWRECCREAASIAAIHSWAADHIDQDNQELVEQIHSKLLPRRGIFVDFDEILITVGAQHSIFMAAQLLLDNSKTIGLENPGYVDARNAFLSYTNQFKNIDIDADGMVISDALKDCDVVYCTPSHQYPSNVTMPQSRRAELLEHASQHDYLIIEDDYESEFNYVGKPTPALKSIDQNGRVIYVSSLSKTLAPGIRLGFIVGPKPFIQQARALRRITLRHPPANNQFIVAQFLKRGYHDALVRRITHTLHHRSTVMQAALDQHFPGAAPSPSFGGSSFWVKGPEGLDAQELAVRARQHGVLIEPGGAFFDPTNRRDNFFRLGFSSIPAAQIEKGISILAGLM